MNMYDDKLMRLKILIIDDDPFDIEMIRSIINDHGDNIFAASNSGQALSLVKSDFEKMNPFHVVFIDYMMPDISGIELCRKLKQIDPDLFIISVTNDNSLETKKDLAKTQLFEGYIFKCRDKRYVKRYLDVAKSTKIKELSDENSVFNKRKKQMKNGTN